MPTKPRPIRPTMPGSGTAVPPDVELVPPLDVPTEVVPPDVVPPEVVPPDVLLLPDLLPPEELPPPPHELDVDEEVEELDEDELDP